MVHPPISTAPIAFHVPRVIHDAIPKGYQFVYHNSLKPGSSIFLGKYKWRENLMIPGDVWQYEHNPEDLVYDFIWKGKADHFRTDGFQLIPDYNSTIFYSSEPIGTREGDQYWTYYPMYLVNETAETKYFIFKRNAVYAIQEAMDLDNVHTDAWWPIEYNKLTESKQGLCALKVYPGEFVLFIVPRYMGPVLTKLRVRLQNGDNIIVSNSFDGHFYPTQYLSDPEAPVHGIIERNDIMAIRSMFLGTMPKEIYPARS